MIDWKTFKQTDGKATWYLVLSGFDTLCIMVSMFAVGMVIDSLLFGNGIAYILLFAAVTVSGAAFARIFLRKGMAHVKYPMILYLNKIGKKESEVRQSLDLAEGLVQAGLVTAAVFLLSPRIAILDVILMCAAAILIRYTEKHMPSGRIRTAMQRTLPYGSVMLLLAFVNIATVMLVKGGMLGMDSAVSIFLFHTVLARKRDLKIGSNIPSLIVYLLSGMAYLFTAGSFSVGLLMAVEMMHGSIKAAYICMTIMPIVSAILLYISQVYSGGKELWWSMVPLVLMHVAVVVTCASAASILGAASAFSMCAIIVLLPVIGVTLYKDVEDEMEQDDDYALYVHIKEETMPAFSAGVLLFIGLMTAIGTVLYIRNAVMYRNMALAVIVFTAWALSPFTYETSSLINAFWNEENK